MGIARGDAEADPGRFVVIGAGAATAEAMAPFDEGNERLDGKAFADHSSVGGGGLIDIFPLRLKAGLDVEKGEPLDPLTGEEAPVGEELFGKMTEG